MHMQKLFTTRITELYGIRLPVVASGLMWLSNADYVAAAANAGIMGFITAASFPDGAALRAEVRRCRVLAGSNPFGVNIAIAHGDKERARIERVVGMLGEEGIRFVETFGQNPEPYLKQMHDAGLIVTHKVPAVRFARKAESVGVDAVIVVGGESGGHPGLDIVGSMVQAAVAARDIRLPLIVSGGMGVGAHIVAALAMGADGIGIGTRFLVAEEIWAHRDYKERLVQTDETQTMLILQSLKKTRRALANEKARVVRGLEREHGPNIDILFPHIAGKVGRAAYQSGDAESAVLSCGQAVAFADRIEPLAAIVARLETEARDALARLETLRSGAQPLQQQRASA
jgi:nitronate monooxygenase